MAVTEFHTRQREQIIKTNNSFIQRLIMAYKRLFKRIQPHIKNIELKLLSQPTITVSQIESSSELTALLQAVEDELTDYKGYVRVELDAANSAALFLALNHVRELYRVYGHQNVNILPLQATDFLSDWLKDGTPFMNRLSYMPLAVKEAMRNVILEGVGLGRNPVEIARWITDQFGMGLTDSVRMMRTLQLYGYREATRANWIAGGVVTGWIWYANLDDRVCMSCVNMHGSIHTLDEMLNDHYAGRCTALSYPYGIEELQRQGYMNGEDWFKAQSEATQQKMMGKQFYEAWIGGAYQFNEQTKIYKDSIFGDMRIRNTLWELLGTEPPQRYVNG